MVLKERPSLKGEGGVLLISCYELGHAPMGVAAPYALLSRAGYHPAAQDLSLQSLDVEMVRQARFVAISVPMHTALRLAIRIAPRIRDLNPAAHLCFHGLYAGLYEEQLLKTFADSIVGGEYRAPLLELVEALEEGTAPVIEGVSTPKSRHPARISRSATLLPVRHGLPALNTYAKISYRSDTKTTGYAEATSGCKHRCLHCPIPAEYKGQFFAAPVEVVLEDIASQIESGAEHITFGDPDFLNGPTHARRLLSAFHERFPKVSYDVTIKVEHLLKHREMIPFLVQTGCLFVVTAVETLNDHILGILDKGHTHRDVVEALHLARDAGLALRPTWMPFTPWAGLEDYLMMLHLIRDEGLVNHVDPVQYTIRMLVPARAPLLDAPAFAPFKKPFDPEAWLHPWVHPDPRMDELHARIASLVEKEAAGEIPATETFQSVLQTAYAAAGDGSAQSPPSALPPQPPAPRLTESWFC